MRMSNHVLLHAGLWTSLIPIGHRLSSAPTRPSLALRTAFISSLAASGFGSPDNIHLQQAVAQFNSQVSQHDTVTAVTVEDVLASPPHQINKARLLSVSAPIAGSWITATPSPGLNWHLECQVALRWWLSLDTAGGFSCPYCPDIMLDPLGHHAVSCRHGGFVVTQHNLLRDILAGFCRKAHLAVKIEVGYGLGRVHINSRPADILIREGAAAQAAEERKHASSDATCEDLGWTCIPLAVESHGNWVPFARNDISLELSEALQMLATTIRNDFCLRTLCHQLSSSNFPGHCLTSLQADEAKAIAAWLPSRSHSSGPKPIPPFCVG
eukprot:Em0002g1073a